MTLAEFWEYVGIFLLIVMGAVCVIAFGLFAIAIVGFFSIVAIVAYICGAPVTVTQNDKPVGFYRWGKYTAIPKEEK